jgi:hypothetical protein
MRKVLGKVDVFWIDQSLQLRTKVSGLFRLESPPRKSPTTRILKSSLQQIAKGVHVNFVPK